MAHPSFSVVCILHINEIIGDAMEWLIARIFDVASSRDDSLGLRETTVFAVSGEWRGLIFFLDNFNAVSVVLEMIDCLLTCVAKKMVPCSCRGRGKPLWFSG
jgi:hypothetical protein